MRFGVRRRNYKSSLKAMTTGRLTRQAKKAFIPFYGKKGTGIYKNPKKALYNKVYRKTTFKFPGLYPSDYKKKGW